MSDTLATLERQTMPPGSYEIIVIDNNCTDATADTVAAFSPRLPIRYLKEAKQGLSHCRNRAIAEFTGDVMLYTDDDMLLEPDWLAGYAEAVARFPAAMIFGSRMVPTYDGARPAWIKDESLDAISGVLGSFDRGAVVRPMPPEENGPFGASFAVRRALIDRIGNFRTDLGRVGTTLGRGEETEFFMRAARAGATRIYVGNALCRHRVEPHRLTVKSLYRQGLQSGKAIALLNGDTPRPTLTDAIVFIVRGILQLLKGRGDRCRQCIMNAGRIIGVRRQLRVERGARG